MERNKKIVIEFSTEALIGLESPDYQLRLMKAIAAAFRGKNELIDCEVWIGDTDSLYEDKEQRLLVSQGEVFEKITVDCQSASPHTGKRDD
jgi:hypothetical protein